MTLDRVNPNVVYISPNAAKPFQLASLTSVPLRANERYEIWRGTTRDGGLTFSWEPITSDSPAENLRPIVPGNHGFDEALVWFHGPYPTCISVHCRVLATLRNHLRLHSSSISPETGAGSLSWASSPGCRYRITASGDFRSFPFEVANGIDAQGGVTHHGFGIPAPLCTARLGFFRVEQE